MFYKFEELNQQIMKNFLTVLTTLILSGSVFGQTPNFSEHISPIIYNKCTKCHRTGEIGPQSFTNFQEVSDWAPTIKYVTEIRYMPPWKPDATYSHFIGENYLSDAEIKLIADWVDAGSPQGDPNKEAKMPVFPKGSQLGTPDLVLSFAKPYTIKNTNTDEYRVFVLPTGLTEDKNISAVEMRPGNLKAVHHALMSWDTTGQAKQLDVATPEYGFTNFGGFGVDGANNSQYPGYVPGQRARYFPDGVAQKMYKGSDFLVQVHYAPSPIEQQDSSSFNIFFSKKPVQRYVYNYIMLPYDLVNGPFIIPKDKEKTFHGVYNVPIKVSVFAVWPHCHLLGKNWEVYAVHPNGDTTQMIKINDWDFKWQGAYLFPKYQVLEPGTKIHAFCTYDNTSNNPLNPNNPPKNITWGEKTSDEMYYLPFSFVLYQAGDENVVFSNELTAVDDPKNLTVEHKLFPVYPNPSGNIITVAYRLLQNTVVNIGIYDVEGRMIRKVLEKKNHLPGEYSFKENIQNLAPGQYVLLLNTAKGKYTQKFSVVR